MESRRLAKQYMAGLCMAGYIVRRIGKARALRYVIAGNGVRVVFHPETTKFSGDRSGRGLHSLMVAIGAPYAHLFSD